MIAIINIVCVVILWSVLGQAVVNGQCTAIGCDFGYHSYDHRSLVREFHADVDNELTSELEDLKLRIQLMADELGKL